MGSVGGGGDAGVGCPCPGSQRTCQFTPRASLRASRITSAFRCSHSRLASGADSWARTSVPSPPSVLSHRPASRRWCGCARGPSPAQSATCCTAAASALLVSRWPPAEAPARPRQPVPGGGGGPGRPLPARAGGAGLTGAEAAGAVAEAAGTGAVTAGTGAVAAGADGAVAGWAAGGQGQCGWPPVWVRQPRCLGLSHVLPDRATEEAAEPTRRTGSRYQTGFRCVRRAAAGPIRYRWPKAAAVARTTSSRSRGGGAAHLPSPACTTSA